VNFSENIQSMAKPKAFETWTKEKQEEWRKEWARKMREYRKKNPDKVSAFDQERKKRYRENKDYCKKQNERQNRWRIINKEKLNKRRAKLRSENPEIEKKRRAKYYAENADKLKQRAKEWRAKNKEKLKQKGKKYRLENIEKVKKIAANYIFKNLDKVKQRRKRYYAENLDKIRQCCKIYHAQNAHKINQRKANNVKLTRQEKAAIQFFQMTQAVAEIATIDTTKIHDNTTRKHVGASI
jgi:hypothetical protein